MSIPIWKTIQDDVIIWPRSKDGSYTVRTGYQLLYEFENSNEATSSNPASSKAFWNRIWKLNIPNKMRFFCRRAYFEALPTLHNLFRHKVVDSSVCISCGQHVETTIHALWDCTTIQPAWGLHFQAIRNAEQGVSTFSDLVRMIEVQHENQELFVVVAWYFWLLRNKNRVNEPCTPIGKICEAAQNTLFEFQSKATPKQPKAIPYKVKWRPSISDFYKANYDGALLEESGEAGLGVVIRNEKGEVMGSLAEKNQ